MPLCLSYVPAEGSLLCRFMPRSGVPGPVQERGPLYAVSPGPLPHLAERYARVSECGVELENGMRTIRITARCVPSHGLHSLR